MILTRLAQVSAEAGRALTLKRVDTIDAYAVVLTRARRTLIDV